MKYYYIIEDTIDDNIKAYVIEADNQKKANFIFIKKFSLYYLAQKKLY